MQIFCIGILQIFAQIKYHCLIPRHLILSNLCIMFIFPISNHMPLSFLMVLKGWPQLLISLHHTYTLYFYVLYLPAGKTDLRDFLYKTVKKRDNTVGRLCFGFRLLFTVCAPGVKTACIS